MTADDVNPDLEAFLWRNCDRTVKLYSASPHLTTEGLPSVSASGLSVLLRYDFDGQVLECHIDLTKVIAWSLLS